MAKITVAVTDITDQECADIMCTALEGGVGYWCIADNVQRSYGNTLWEYKSFDAYEDEDPENFFGVVTYDTIREGVNRIVAGDVTNSYIRNMVLANFQDDEPMDADGADSVVQAGLFNEIVYG